MTAKQFFKSTSFKCIVTLLCVLLVSGIFLTIMSGLLHVSDEERLARAISKIYGQSVSTEMVEIKNGALDDADILEAHHVLDDGNYLVKSRGKGGFAGTVTCWVVVKIDNNKVSGIKKVTIDSYVGETQMAEIKDSFLSNFSKKYVDDIIYSTDSGFLVSGSTRSSNAICNAVNGAIAYVKSEVLGISLVDRFEGFEHTDFIDKNSSDFTVNEDKSVTFTLTANSYGYTAKFGIIVTVGADKTIKAYEITKNGSTEGFDANMPSDIKDGSRFVGKDLSYFTGILGNELVYPGDNAGSDISSGATNSNYVCMRTAAFALINYQKAYLADLDIFENFEYIDVINTKTSSYTVNDDNSVSYSLTSVKYGYTVDFIINITVGADKTIKAYEITKNGSTEGFDANMPSDIKDGSRFVGKDLSYFTGILGNELVYPGDNAGSDISSGATNSNYVCMRTAAFALANYDKCISIMGGNVNE